MVIGLWFYYKKKETTEQINLEITIKKAGNENTSSDVLTATWRASLPFRKYIYYFGVNHPTKDSSI